MRFKFLIFFSLLSGILKAEAPLDLIQETERQSAATHGMESLQPIVEWDPNNEQSVILLHGLFEDPGSMRMVANEFKAKGYNVFVPLLPGHGYAFEGAEKVTAESLKSFLNNQIQLLGALGQKVTVLGFSIGGVMSWNHVATRLARNEDIPHIEHVIQLSPAFDEVEKVKSKASTYKNGAIIQLRKKFGVDPDTAEQRGPAISDALVGAMQELREEINRVGEIEVPSKLRVSFLINPNDNIADFDADQRVVSRARGESVRMLINSESARHVNVPQTKSMIQLLGTQIFPCKKALVN